MKFASLCVVSAFLAVASPGVTFAQASKTEGGGYEVIANAFGFGIDVQDCPSVSKNIREISIDELNIDIREMTTGLDVEYRLYGPGQAHWGSAKFTCVVRPGEPNELQAWFQEAAQGKEIRKNITVNLFKSNKQPGRSYTLNECFPTHYEEADDTEHDERVCILTVKPGGIVLSPGSSSDGSSSRAEATSSDKFAQVRGFKVDIANAGGKEVDTAWESVSGGEMIIETTDSHLAHDLFRSTEPTAKSTGKIQLTGFITPTRKEMLTWINETVEGKPWKRMLTITELLSVDGGVKDGKQYIYHDCFPCRYVFPRLSVYNQLGNAQEEVHVMGAREPIVAPNTIWKVDIENCPIASRSVLAARLDDRALDMDLHPKSKTIRNEELILLFPPGGADELHKWFGQADAGPIGITISSGNKKSGGRTYKLHDCVRVGPRMAVTNTTGNVMEEVAIKPIRVELK